jgi:dipeptidyl-peptidase-4
VNKEIKRITEGNYQVEVLNFVDEDRKLIYFTSTIESPIERHLYSVAFNGKNLKRITQEKGTHNISFGDNSNYYVDYYSNITRPTKVLIHTVDGSPYLMLDENKAPILEYDILKPEIFTFKDNEGNIFYGQLIKPANFDNTRKYPLIVYVYGGPGSQSVRDMWGGNRYLFNQFLANKGYIIFTMDNRGSYGRGREWENVLYKEFGKNELEDQLKGIEYVKSLGFIDEDRIGIWGWSYGGYFTTYAMTKRPDIFKVGVAGAPVIDWKNYDTIYTERYLKLPQDNEEGYMWSSPLNYIENLTGDYLIIHGTADDNVHIQNSIQLISKAVELNKMINVMIYPGEMHGFGDISSIHLYNLISEFFTDNL